MGTRTLFRPVGLFELELILDADARSFPPRLPEQPIFYPVLNQPYAAQIASNWNPSDPRSGFAGFVTEFEVDAAYADSFEIKGVGGAQHQELWVPAEQLPTFNAHLRSKIRATTAFFGPSFQGPAPLPTILRGLNANRQLKMLHDTLSYSGFDFALEVDCNWKLVLINFGFWAAVTPEQQGLNSQQSTRTLSAIRKAWSARHSDLVLPGGALVP